MIWWRRAGLLAVITFCIVFWLIVSLFLIYWVL
jgi:hypothetical protein